MKEAKEVPDSPVMELAKKCMDAPGYLVFVAIITPGVQKDENPVINFHYERYHYPFEDIGKAISALKKHFKDDLDREYTEGQVE